MNIKQQVEVALTEAIELRRDFHAYPELGFQEHRTAGKVEEFLRGLGLAPVRVAGTGVSAVLEGVFPGPTLMLRADIDALPIQEENTISYASRNPGVMHACGHDAHTAMLLSAARILCSYTDKIAGRIKFVFQPNEEVSGAAELVRQGVMDNPAVDAALGVHIWSPLRSGEIGIKEGACMASMDVFKITLFGQGGHTGYPESAIDPILAAADLIQSAQIIQTRQISLMKPTVLMFGKVSAGSKNNIIPDQAVLEGSLRYLYAGGPASEERPSERLESIVKQVCGMHGCTYSFEVHQENHAVINDRGMVNLARQVAVEM
ncbi:MAG: amidohydrolase, partial [Spirochaetota bacterium]